MNAKNALRDTIAQQLSTDPHVGSQPVRFEIVGEDVVLMGAVRTYFQKQMAQETLRRVGGVGQILNTLEIVRN